MTTKRVYGSNDDYILTEEEQKIIVDWVRKSKNKLDQNGFNRWKKELELLNDVPDCIWDIKSRIVKKEKLEEAKEERYLKDSVGYMCDGGQLHKHTDPNDGDLVHTRFNAYVQIPYVGGLPIYNNKILELKERTYICCKAGIEEHYCQMVEGERERIILSFGFLLPYESIKNIEYKYDNICN